MRRAHKTLAVITAASLALAAHQGWRLWELRRLEGLLTELREDGFVTTSTGLIPDEVPAEDNAAPLYEAAISLLSAGGTEEDALALAVRAAERPSCVFRGAQQQDFVGRLPDAGVMVQLAELLGERALEARDFDPAGLSVRDLRAAFALGRHIGRDPVLLAKILRIAIARKGLDATRALALESPDPARFFAAVDPDEPRGVVADGIAGEFSFVQWMLDPGGLIEMVGAKPGVWVSLKSALLRPSDLRSTRRHLARLREASMAARLPPAEGTKILRRLQEEARSGGRVEVVATAGFDGLLRSETGYLHRVTLTRIGVQLLERRRDSGAFPADLDFVAADDRTDPLTGGVITWTVDGDSGVLRSADGSDSWALSIQTRDD